MSRTIDHPLDLLWTRARDEASGLRRGTPQSVALDLETQVNAHILAGEAVTLPTGIRIVLPMGTCGLVLPRSGLAFHHGITLANSPGLIDQDYRGEILVKLQMQLSFSDLIDFRNGEERRSKFIQKGDRIAQLLIVDERRVKPSLISQENYEANWTTERGRRGFGSTGS